MTLRLKDFPSRVSPPADSDSGPRTPRVDRVWLSRWRQEPANGTDSGRCGLPCRAECGARWLGGRACGFETSGTRDRDYPAAPPPGGESA